MMRRRNLRQDRKRTMKVKVTDGWGFGIGTSTLVNVHTEDKCKGETCLVHNPSNHHMRKWPMLWRSDIGVMERTCKHGVGHPDPDDAAFHTRNGREWAAVHGCDGCCLP